MPNHLAHGTNTTTEGILGVCLVLKSKWKWDEIMNGYMIYAKRSLNAVFPPRAALVGKAEFL